MNISEAINKLMSERKENSYSLAKKVHIPQPTIYSITTGQTLEPKQENIDKLAKYFGVSDPIWSEIISHERPINQECRQLLTRSA